MLNYIYLAIGLAAATAIAFGYKLTDKTGSHHIWMMAAMGIVALFLNLVLAAFYGIDIRQAHISQFLAGAMKGVCFIICVPCLIAAMARGKLAASWTVLTLGFAVVPIIAMFYPLPPERPTVIGMLGLVFAAAAIILLGWDNSRQHPETPPHVQAARKGWGILIFVAFLSNAAILYSYKLAASSAPDASLKQKLAFTVTSTGLMGIGSAVFALLMPQKGNIRTAMSVGALNGFILFVAGLVALLALGVGVPSYVYFPATTGGSSILVALLSVLFIKERHSLIGWLGIALGVVSLVLLGGKQP